MRLVAILLAGAAGLAVVATSLPARAVPHEFRHGAVHPGVRRADHGGWGWHGWHHGWHRGWPGYRYGVHFGGPGWGVVIR